MFSKEAITIPQQIKRLKERGLRIFNEKEAEKYLSNVSYYRLGEYWYVMVKEPKKKHFFENGSTFENVITLYNFDAELRLLLFNVIEKIEISLRTKLIYHLSCEKDPWWFCNSGIFKDQIQFSKTLSTIERDISRAKNNNITIKNHFKKYKNDSRFPPAWKTLEQVSFGNLSKLYGNLKHDITAKDKIAKEYGAVHHSYLTNWLQSISQIRNLCAHHSRLWNRKLTTTVKLLTKPPNPWIEDLPKTDEMRQLYVNMCLMKYLLNTIHSDNNFTQCLNSLFKKYPDVNLEDLGIKKDWQKEPLWK
ncbi:MAG: Abi family protein [Ekhidna sp.]|nr:Abi family protein [Ekhidna sp.]